jgi:hypothetical protein
MVKYLRGMVLQDQKLILEWSERICIQEKVETKHYNEIIDNPTKAHFDYYKDLIFQWITI